MNTESTTYTLRFLLDNSVRSYEPNLALAYIQKQQITYHELGHMISQMESWFLNHNIAKGDKIAILSENSPHWAVSFFAITHLGAVAVPILPDFSINEVNNILHHSDSKMVFISHRLLTKHGDDLKFRGQKILLDHFQVIGTEDRILDFDPKQKRNIPELPALSPDDLASIIYTSGTTGRSKGVMLSHENLTYVPE
ncbi:MAG: AMP-binding protein, partial [Bacteroidales bacterium]